MIKQFFNQKCLINNSWKIRLAKGAFAQQVGTTLLAQGITLIFSLITAAVIARWLGPAGKGQLAIILMVPMMFRLFLGMGLDVANVYYVGSARLPIGKLTANSVAFSILGTIVGFFAILIILLGNFQHSLLPGISSGYLILGMIALPLGLLNNNLSSILQGLQRILTLNILTAVGSISTLLFVTLLVVGLQFGIPGALAATLLVQTGMLLATGSCIGHKEAHFWPKYNPQIIRPTLTYGLKSYVGNLLQFFNYRLDIFVVNFFLGPSGVGIYGVSVAIAELLWQLPNAASFVIFSKSVNSSQETMNRFTPKIFWIVLTMSIIGAIGLALFGKLIIILIFSGTFVDAYTPLLILLPGVVLLGAGKVLTNDIAGRGYPQYNSITSGLSLLLTIVLDLILIPSMGVVGAALASTASYAMTLLISIVFYFLVSGRNFNRNWNINSAHNGC